jgi:hypothetical protein
MVALDLFVKLRERLLGVVLGIEGAPLNNAHAAGTPRAAGLAAALKGAADALAAVALSRDGAGVDYARVRSSEAYAALHNTLTPQLRSFALASLVTDAERLAFWINLYNVMVIDAAVSFGIRRSVTEGRAGVLAFFRRAAYDVGGLRFSANDVEHGILRANRPHWSIPGPQFGPGDPRLEWRVARFDPRIHFALNCASRSCPPIAFYDPARIDTQLDLAAAAFISGSTTCDPARGAVRLSSIFKWYAADFGGRAGVSALLRRHLPEGDARATLLAQEKPARLVYEPYDWGLNEQTMGGPHGLEAAP